MSLEKLLVISSEDKDPSSNSNSDFVVSLKETYYTQNIDRIMIKDIIVPNVFPNIRGESYGTSKNNIFRIQDTLGNLSPEIIIPEGQYVISTLGVPPPNDLITLLETIYNTTIALPGETLTITLDPITQKLNFTFAGGFGYDFADTSVSPLNSVLGIKGPTESAGLNINAQSITDLGGYPMVYVHSKKLAESNGIDGDFGLISLAEAVSLADAPFGSYAYRQNNDDELSTVIYENPRNLSRIQIVLRDNQGNKLDIGTHTMTIIFKAILSSG